MHKGAMYVFSAIFFQSHCIITQWRAFSLLTKYLLISYYLTQMAMEDVCMGVELETLLESSNILSFILGLLM